MSEVPTIPAQEMFYNIQKFENINHNICKIILLIIGEKSVTFAELHKNIFLSFVASFDIQVCIFKLVELKRINIENHVYSIVESKA